MGSQYSTNEGFFNKWNSEMAYVLGYIYADGTIYSSSRGKYLAITSIDESTLVKIKNWLSDNHNITSLVPNWPGGKTRFKLRIGNRHLYNSLMKLGLYPSKSLTIRMPLIPKKFLHDFIRGYFDGDGCVHIYRSKGIKQKIILRKLTVIFTSGSRKFLRDLLDTLRSNLIIKQDKVYTSQRSYQLRFATADSINLFRFLYKGIPKQLFLNRKFDIFDEYFGLRPQRIDKSIESILRFHKSAA